MVVADKKAGALKIVEDKVEVLPSFSRAEHEAWFDGNIHHYKSLGAMVAATLKSTLDGHGISYVDIPYREKGKKSFLKKMDDKKKNKDYSPNDMTDLAGIRVITLIESDVKKVGELIHSLFNVHPEDSINKSASLGEDKVGYRSVHFVCDIGETREGLLEWKALKGLCFEIQVRTALEHAWAEIEHDRGYKLGGKLPSHLSRRFSLLSGLLESADLEFNRLTVEIEEYAKTLKQEIQDNSQLDFELSSIAIQTLIQHIFPKTQIINAEDDMLDTTLNETINFGITNLNQLNSLLIKFKPFLSELSEIKDTGIICTALMLENLDEYMSKSWSKSDQPFTYIPDRVIQVLKAKYENIDLENYFSNYNIKIFSDN